MFITNTNETVSLAVTSFYFEILVNGLVIFTKDTRKTLDYDYAAKVPFITLDSSNAQGNPH